MEHHSRIDVCGGESRILDAHLRESFGRVVYSHKVQEKEADLLLRRLANIQLGQVVLPAISTGTFVSVLLGTGWWGTFVGAASSGVLLGLNLYSKSHDLRERAREHKDAAIEIWLIREQYLSLITDLALGVALSDIRSKRDYLLEKLKEVYTGSPTTSRRAYRKARRALNMGAEMTFTTGEVDSLLPPELRRSHEE